MLRKTDLKKAFEFYFKQVIPRVGGWVTGQRFAYEYLNKSSRGFPSRERFLEVMRALRPSAAVNARFSLAEPAFYIAELRSSAKNENQNQELR